MAAREMEARIRAMLPNLKTGSLLIWGQWFGRPHDNIHRIVACSARDNELCLGFDDDETLTVWVPADLTANADVFSIRSAARVRWEWFHYGRPKLSQNRCFHDFSKVGANISATSNLDWYRPSFVPSPEHNAVEII